MINVSFDHFIGLNTDVKILLHPSGESYVYSSGAHVIISDARSSNSRIYRGHDDFITAIAISKDGKLVASGQKGTNSNVIVWSYETMEEFFRFEEHDYMVQCLDFSEDCRVLVTGGNDNDGKIFFLDVSNGYIISSAKLPPETNTIITGGFVKDIKKRDTDCYLFASGGFQGVILWSLNPFTGEIDTALASGDPRASVTRQFTSLAFSVDKEVLFGATLSGDFVLINIRNQRIFQVISGVKLSIDTIATTNDLGVLIGGGDGTIKYYNSNMQFVEESRLDSRVRCITLNRHAEHLIYATTANGSIVRVDRKGVNNYNPVSGGSNKSGGLVTVLSESHSKSVISVAFSPRNNERLASASYDGTLRVWDITEYTTLAVGTARKQFESNMTPNCMIFTDTQLLLSGWSDGKVLAHSSETGELYWMIDNAHTQGGVTSITMSSNRRFILTGGYTGDVRMWELRSRQMMAQFKDHNSQVTGLQVSDKDSTLISCSRDRSIIRTDLVKERRQFTHTQRIGGINAFTLSKDETLIMSVGQEKRLTCWECFGPNPIYAQPLQAEEDEGRCVVVSPNGQWLATGGSAGVLRIWKVGTWEKVLNLNGHSGGINSISFSPDGKQIATGGDDGCIFTWNVTYQ